MALPCRGQRKKNIKELNKIEQEQEGINLLNNTDSKVETKQGFAERRSR